MQLESRPTEYFLTSLQTSYCMSKKSCPLYRVFFLWCFLPSVLPPIWVGTHQGLLPSGLAPIRVGSNQGWQPSGLATIRVGGNQGWRPSGLATIRVSNHRVCCNLFVYVSMCPRSLYIVTCGKWTRLLGHTVALYLQTCKCEIYENLPEC